MPQHPAKQSPRSLQLGLGLTLGLALVLGASALPPLVPETWRPVLMQAFAGVCHQLPERSPHVDGVALAVCDRCAGIYTGVVLGAVLATVGRWNRLSRTVLLGMMLPLALDWIGPWMGWWTNTPLSRAGTGLLFGAVAGALLLIALLHAVDSRQASPSVT